MKFRSIIAGAIALALSSSLAFAQTNQGSSPQSIAKGGTGAATASAARTNLGVAIGSNVEAWDADLDCIAANSTAGLHAYTGTGTCAFRILTAPAAGFTITNPAGTAGNPTFVLANDLAALEGLSGTGFAVRSGTDTWVQRAIGGTTNQICVTNGDGVSSAPTLSLCSTLVLTGLTVTVTTQSPADNSTKVATTAYADAIAALKANLASPTFSGTVKSSSGPFDAANNAFASEVANAGTTGTTVNKLAKLTGSPATAVIATTSDTTGNVIGIVIAGAGTTGNAQIANAGQASCVFDGAITAGHFVQVSTTAGGSCHDGGATFPTSGQIIGLIVAATNASPGSTPQAVTLFAPGTVGTSNSASGTVTSVVCGTGLSGGTITTTGTCALALTNTSITATPSDPTGTASTTGAMMGLGTTCKLTPTYSGRVYFEIYGVGSNTGANNFRVNARIGTGTAPANAAAPSGTQVGSTLISSVPGSGQQIPYKIGGIIATLTPGTAYWFDVDLFTSTGTASILETTCNAFEF